MMVAKDDERGCVLERASERMNQRASSSSNSTNTLDLSWKSLAVLLAAPRATTTANNQQLVVG